MLDVTDLKGRRKFKNANKRWRRLLMLSDLMLEVGLDGTIYNYHSHRKDSFTESTDRFMARKFKCCLQMLQIQLSLQYVKLLKMVFNQDVIYRRKEKMRWYELSAPMEETEEHDTHFICLSRDITKVKLVDESLARSEEGYRGY
jgi:hypothetical protein